MGEGREMSGKTQRQSQGPKSKKVLWHIKNGDDDLQPVDSPNSNTD